MIFTLKSIKLQIYCLTIHYTFPQQFVSIEQSNTIFELGQYGNDLRMMCQIMECKVGFEQVIRDHAADLKIVTHQ